MEENRKDAGNQPADKSSAETPRKSPNAPSAEPPSSRRRGGGQKRKAQSLSNSSTSQSASSSKRQAREKPSAVPFPQIHNGPCTRARQQPNSADNSAVKSEAVAAGGTPESRLVKLEEELSTAREDYEALEAKLEAEYEAIRSCGSNSHVVPIHCGWFSWTKIHPLEERSVPSFFSGKSENRTPEIYMEIRNCIMNKFHRNPNTQIETKDLSELSVGEPGAKQEVMEFLDYWGLINYHPFPEMDSVAPSIDADVAANAELLLEKLYHFDTEQSCAPVDPRSNEATPAVPSRLFPESSAIAEELARPEGPAYHCNSCSADCSRKRYHCQKQADYDLCSECFSSGKFDSDMSPSDFILMEPADAAGASGGKWTDQETLLLLEALELFKENWNEIAEHVATKTKAQCILHFVQMPIADTFMDCDDETDMSPKENAADPGSIADDDPSPKDANETNKDAANENLVLTTPMEILKPADITEPEIGQESGEIYALKALREAFEAVGSLPSPEERLSFAEAGNPVMALAAFLVQLVEPSVVTASARTSLKSISGKASGIQLAARHCFLLEDPIDEKKEPTDSLRVVAEVVGQEGQKDENQSGNKEEENSKLVSKNSDSPKDEDSEKNKSSVNGESFENSHEEVALATLDKSGNENLSKEKKASNGEDYTVELPSSSPEESDGTKLERAASKSLKAPNEDEMLLSQSTDVPKDEVMSDSVHSEKKRLVQLVTSNSLAENVQDTDKNEAQDGANANKDSAETKADPSIDKLKRAAVTAISAAAVKAKKLANQEEDHIRQLATILIEKQLHKLESKLAFFTEMDSLVMRVRELLERSKQRLYQERAQIIAARFGMSASSSSRPMPPQSLPVNRATMLFANSAPRPPGSMTFHRPPISRQMMASGPSTVAGHSAQPSNQDKFSSLGMK